MKDTTVINADVVKDLAPTGKLRASINLGNIVLAQGTPDAPRGITVDLSRELARRLGVPVEFTCFDAAGKAFDAFKAGGLDIIFLAIEPVRADEIAFSEPHVLIEGVYMVRKDSPIKSNDEIDRDAARRISCALRQHDVSKINGGAQLSCRREVLDDVGIDHGCIFHWRRRRLGMASERGRRMQCDSSRQRSNETG